MLKAVTPNTRVMFVANPNNPTGAVAPLPTALAYITGEAHPPGYDYQPTNVVFDERSEDTPFNRTLKAALRRAGPPRRREEDPARAGEQPVDRFGPGGLRPHRGRPAERAQRRDVDGRGLRGQPLSPFLPSGVDVDTGGLDGPPVRAVFIRAPWIAEHGEDVEILASVDGHPVAARQGNVLAISFHPEIAGESRLHEMFLREAAVRA